MTSTTPDNNPDQAELQKFCDGLPAAIEARLEKIREGRGVSYIEFTLPQSFNNENLKKNSIYKSLMTYCAQDDIDVSLEAHLVSLPPTEEADGNPHVHRETRKRIVIELTRHYGAMAWFGGKSKKKSALRQRVENASYDAIRVFRENLPTRFAEAIKNRAAGIEDDFIQMHLPSGDGKAVKAHEEYQALRDYCKNPDVNVRLHFHHDSFGSYIAVNPAKPFRRKNLAQTFGLAASPPRSGISQQYAAAKPKPAL